MHVGCSLSVEALTYTGSIFAASISDATVVNSFFSVSSFVRLVFPLTKKFLSRVPYQAGQHSNLGTEYQHSVAHEWAQVFLCSLTLLLVKG